MTLEALSFLCCGRAHSSKRPGSPVSLWKPVCQTIWPLLWFSYAGTQCTYTHACLYLWVWSKRSVKQCSSLLCFSWLYFFGGDSDPSLSAPLASLCAAFGPLRVAALVLLDLPPSENLSPSAWCVSNSGNVVLLCLGGGNRNGHVKSQNGDDISTMTRRICWRWTRTARKRWL